MERRENIGIVPPVRADGPQYWDETIEVERIDTPARTLVARDRVRWGPVWAGLMTTLSIFLLLTLLMYGIGAQRLTVANNTRVDNTNTWLTVVIGLVSFFLGGWVATQTAFVRGTAAGLLNGFLVWALGLVLILALSSLGVGMAFGAAGNIFDQLITVQRSQINLPNFNIPEVSRYVQSGALWGFISLAIAAGSAMLGGWLGSKGRPLGHVRTEAHT